MLSEIYSPVMSVMKNISVQNNRSYNDRPGSYFPFNPK